MSATTLCCTQLPRIDSPEPPARPIAAIDEIFAAAALPEDHPHAFRFPDRKAAAVDANIIRSPKITDKLRMKLNRKSIKSLHKALTQVDYDDDAQAMTSTEVFHHLGARCETAPTLPVPSACTQKLATKSRRFDSASGSASGDAVCLQNISTHELAVRSPATRSFEWLGAMLQSKPDEANVAEIAGAVADRYPTASMSGLEHDMTSPLPKAMSSPNLLFSTDVDLGTARRSQSDFALTTPKMRARGKSNSSLDIESILAFQMNRVGETAEGSKSVLADGRIEDDATDQQMLTTLKPNMLAADTASNEPEAEVAETKDVHLHTMAISEQLRSMSQMSDAVEDQQASTKPLIFQPLRPSSMESSTVCEERGQHVRHLSGCLDDHYTGNFPKERVRSPIQDTSSSMYSQPCSAAVNGKDAQAPLYAIPKDLDALSARWPLNSDFDVVTQREDRKHGSSSVSSKALQDKPFPPTPPDTEGRKSASASFVDDEVLKGNSPHRIAGYNRAQPIPSKSSSSTSTKTSKQSKFLERFSPPKKTVTKRRSIFKFLRPGSRKQVRSISSPMLRSPPVNSSAIFDGPADDRDLLTVQYELAEHPAHHKRSITAGNLNITGTNMFNPSATPNAPERRATLAEYERNLTVEGDNRRKSSSINLQRLQELQEEDRRESLGIRRKLSRAKNLVPEEPNPLMAEALKKHQQEKAMFRSESKRKESSASRPSFVFNEIPFSLTSGSVPSPSVKEQTDLLDPLDKDDARGRSYGVGQPYLEPPSTPTAGPSRRPSTLAISKYGSSSKSSKTSMQLPKTPRMGTSLVSWSRYPSHTRAKRCGSAGHLDSISTHDFATGTDHRGVRTTEELGPDSPTSKHSKSTESKRSKNPLIKSRSMTFRSVVRYYHNLLTSTGFIGQNRRTSVTVGGHLQHPELEMISPVTASDHHGHHIHEHLRKIEEQMVDDVDELFHHHKHLHHQPPRNESPFRQGGLFGGGSRTRQQTETATTDSDDLEQDLLSDIIDPAVVDVHTLRVSDESALETSENVAALDGTAQEISDGAKVTPSKAEAWSAVYKECLSHPDDVTQTASETETLLPKTNSDRKIMPPSSLKPVKARSPQQPKQLDGNVRIRRYPSVTVIDDRKGHVRSVSLISTQSLRSAKSTGDFERESTMNLLELIQKREQEEREKLLRNIEMA